MIELHRKFSTIHFPWIKEDDENNVWEFIGTFDSVETIETYLAENISSAAYEYQLRNIVSNPDGTL